MAQGTPQDMQHATPLIQGTSAELVAYLLWGGDNKSAICVSLAHREGAWRITNALDMQTEEKQQECGGMKTAAGEWTASLETGMHKSRSSPQGAERLLWCI